MSTVHDLMEKYFVAVKVLLRDKNNLLIVHDIYGAWELPGGRIRKAEFNSPIETIVERKIREELGPDVRYELGEPKATFRVERHEEGLNETIRIFAVGYEARYLGGEIKVWRHHNDYKWVDISSFKPREIMTPGWLEGVEEYLKRVKS